MRRFRRTTLILVACLAVLVGIGLSRKVSWAPGLWIFIFLPAFLLLKRRSFTSLVLVIVLGLSLGLWRGTIYMQKLEQIKALDGQRATIEATAKSDAVYAAGSQLEFLASNIKLIYPSPQRLAGTFKIRGFGVPMVYRGDQLTISGKLYTTRGSNQAIMSYTQLQIISSGNDLFAKASRSFSTGMENSLPEPVASFGLGLLIGQRTNLPPDIINDLTAVALIHIVAVSGYNLTILVRASQRAKLGSKYQRTLISLGLIISFLMITGFSASIVRAAVVSVLSIWAAYYGRQIRPIVLIVFAAALTGVFSPFYVWSDIGWYLSFLAFFGVLIIAPAITARLFKRTPGLLTMVAIESMSAEIMTLPLIMMTFGQLSLIGLLANLLIVPLVPGAMLLAAISALSGVIFPAFAGWIAWPAKALLTYMLDMVHMLASVPSIFLRVSISPTAMISSYICILLLILALYKRLRLKPSAVASG